MVSNVITLDIQIAAQRSLLLRFGMYTPQWYAVNNDLSAMVCEWRKTNTLKVAR